MSLQIKHIALVGYRRSQRHAASLVAEKMRKYGLSSAILQ